MPTVRPAAPDDLRATSRLHRQLLPDGFFARLGRGFLCSYHRTFARSPHAVAFVTGPAGDADGFLVGTLSNRQHYRFVVRCCGVRLAARGLLALAARPRLAWTFLRTRAGRYLRWALRYPLRPARRPSTAEDLTAPAAETRPDPAGEDAPAEPAAAPVAVLTHVAVGTRAQGNGTGRALVEAFVAAAREAGVTEARLVTDAGGPAEAFYRRLGWTPGQVRHGSGGSLVREFRLSLHENAPS
ncbi:GNAT family N-acetyltransferase [Egicoccus sp. AB-alg2]|uniref:GNAT family N-acetyltransferase n=1 Tax=Egicoccus sp. AB-alg2 TaxID=3242693 RepID=UPI00359E2309